MNITHVLRAEEHLPNTLRQVITPCSGRSSAAPPHHFWHGPYKVDDSQTSKPWTHPSTPVMPAGYHTAAGGSLGTHTTGGQRSALQAAWAVLAGSCMSVKPLLLIPPPHNAQPLRGPRADSHAYLHRLSCTLSWSPCLAWSLPLANPEPPDPTSDPSASAHPATLVRSTSACPSS